LFVVNFFFVTEFDKKNWVRNAMAELDKETPQVGLRFRNPDKAWQFWVAYGGHTGF
jgi:hypothetical protein